ncbi:MAG: class I SAM-dependent methyltransferase [Chloroflexi bacterium]|nr:class I SAM-dependent methyltransferase [Chloroflexota bacterium]
MRLAHAACADYGLLDSGGGRKLERFGAYRFVRPEAQALWKPALADEVWAEADGEFVLFEGQKGALEGGWRLKAPLPERWLMQCAGLRFWVQPTPYRHMGVFPEQAAQWDWLRERITHAGRLIRVLNLFAYTGGATLAAAAAAAQVTHVDAARNTVAWARENALLSDLAQRPIRWIVDDALKFVQREGRRGQKYDVILLDPPPFGHGPRGEVWKFDKSLPLLLEACRGLWSAQPLALILTAYSAQSSPQKLYAAISELMAAHGGLVEAGTLVTYEQSAGRALTGAMFARWSA